MNAAKKEQKDITTLRQIGNSVHRLHEEVKRLEGEIKSLESDLAIAGGSTKSSAEVQEEIEAGKAEQYVFVHPNSVTSC